MDLAAAARRTLEEATARVRLTSGVDGARFIERETGVTDFALRRTHTRVETGPWLEEFVDRMLERHPWMDTGEQPDRDPPTAERLRAGTACFTRFGDGWTADRGQVWAPERSLGDPLWIVERLTGEGPGFRLAHHAGEAWLDDEGRIARVRWAPIVRSRPRAPWPRFIKRPPVHELELFDYGVPAAIAIPQARPPSDGSWFSLVQLAGELLKLRVANR